MNANTQVALLLTAPLLSGPRTPDVELLQPSEWTTLVRHLNGIACEPGDLLGSEAADLIRRCADVVPISRLQGSLARGFLMGQAIERWRSRSIWVLGTSESGYPPSFKMLLGDAAPPLLYGCGEPELLTSGGWAVLGSRDGDDESLAFTHEVGQLAATAGVCVMSGGARGVDQAAARGALDAGGNAVAVLADSLERAAMLRENREPLLEGRLTLVSPYDPLAGFNVGHAMARNKLIYALADAALVVQSDLGKGGTWAGAVEQLDKFRWVPVFVRLGQDPSPGMTALQRKGAIPWPDPATVKFVRATHLSMRSRGPTLAVSESVDTAPDAGPDQRTLFD